MISYWHKNRYGRTSNLTLLTTLLAFFVILLGAYTRLTNAGLSCPDWPHCYGFVTAPHTASQLQVAATRFPDTQIDVQKAWTEMTHRYFAGTEALLILILTFSAFLSKKLKDFKFKMIGIFLILLLGIQIALGMLTVTEKLKPVIVLAHLLTGISILSVLWWSFLELRYKLPITNKILNKIKPWVWAGFFIIIAQITFGGWVSTHYAGLACIDLPYCNGKLIPTMQWGQLNTDLITIHMLHRIGAIVTVIYLLFLSMLLMNYSGLRRYGLLLIAVLALQVTLGVLNVLWLRPVPIALLHHATGIVILLMIIAVLVQVHFNTKEHRYVSWIA